MTAPAATQKLNDAQRAALDLGRDLLVSAGAGAGKTQVLGLRYLAALETGRARVGDILAFTFTEKAAAEMRQRVQQLLLARLGELRAGPGLANLIRARNEFANNRISTVHAFCKRLLTEYAWEAGLEPNAPVLDERDQRMARDAAIRRVLLQVGEDDPLAPVLQRLSANARLYSLTAMLHRALRERESLGNALREAAKAWANPDAEIARRKAAWEQWLAQALAPALQALARLDMRAAKTAGETDKLAADVFAATEAAKQLDLGALATTLLRADRGPRSFSNKGRKAAWPGNSIEAARETLTEAANLLAEPMAELGKYEFDAAHERRCGEVLVDLHALFERAAAAYEEECAGALDFLDMELRAIKLLQGNPGVLAELNRRTLLILVDEYQDTNPTQSELFKLLIHGDDTPGRFFAVGDAKQSIYGFRGSDVSIFNNAKGAIKQRNRKLATQPQELPWGLHAEDTPERRSGIIGMDTNYRTVEPVLQAGNAIFRKVFARDEYRAFDARPQDMEVGTEKKADAPASVELHLMPSRRQTDDAGIERSATEAEVVARRVAELIAEGVPPGDVALLVRRGTRNNDYRAAFATVGVPLLLVGDSGLLGTQEALDCINLLRVAANPGDDMAALGVLRSPFCGMSDRDLTRLALSTRGPTLLARLHKWDGLAQCAPARRFAALLAQLSRMAGREPPTRLLSHATAQTGYALAVGCGSEAEQRLGNLGRILEVIRDMQRQYPALAALARELAKRADEGDDEPQAMPEQGAQGVRLMTVHRSKGLEFPIVIVPDLGSRPGGADVGIVRDLPAPGLPLGLWLRSLEAESRGDYLPDFAAWRARAEAAQREAAEEKRTLYVAWTRAAKRLILVGTVQSEIKGESWAAQILHALGIHERGQTPPLPAGMALHWHEATEGHAPRMRTKQIAALRKAIEAGNVMLPQPVDTSLVAPLPQPVTTPQIAEPEAAEFGTLVHAAIERTLRTGQAETGFADARVGEAAGRALRALETLRPARDTLPEFSFVTPQGVKRLDLLRALDGDEYEIVDFKTDETPGDVRAKHGEQLTGYANALCEYLKERGKPARNVRTLVCLTAPNLPDNARLVEITP